MKLKELLKRVEVKKMTGDVDVDVRDIAYRSGDVKKGSCFVAIKGAAADGHDFVADAVSMGAVAIVTSRAIELPSGAVCAVVPDTRKALARMSSAFFGDPSSSMKLVGVTGTNGKTTVTYLLEAVFSEAGMRAGVIGTIGCRFAGKSESVSHTTPESYELQRIFGRMRDAGVEACSIEVSSHALAQSRVEACHFDAAVFTNLTPEHQDYHDGMEDYFAAKAVLFEEMLAATGKKGAFAVINADDPYGTRLIDRCKVPVITYGLNGRRDVTATDLRFGSEGLSMNVATPDGKFNISSKLCGSFNAMNILAAVACASRFGVRQDIIAKAMEKVDRVPGRFEPVGNGEGVLAIVDYAHTPDALDNVLKHAREISDARGGRLIAVFGCGGDRDKKKRPEMGAISARLADIVIVTSDNPRSERPASIMDEILAGMSGKASEFDGEKGYMSIEDRREAIARSVAVAKKNDVIVVAGKGHEDYQIIGKERRHFDDREVLREMLGR